jgi:ankyrin repeat protein
VHANADVCAQDKYNKYTPLHWAVVRGHVETIEALVQAKADVGAQDKWKYTPLHWAAYKGHANIIEPLVNAKADVCAQNRYGKTPLDVAVDNKNEAAFITLAEKGMMDEESTGIAVGHESIRSENPAVQPEKVLCFADEAAVMGDCSPGDCSSRAARSTPPKTGL